MREGQAVPRLVMRARSANGVPIASSPPKRQRWMNSA